MSHQTAEEFLIHFTEKLSLITLVHGDAHEKQTLKTLNHIFPCHLTLRKAQGQNLSSGIWRKASGKVIDCVNKSQQLLRISTDNACPFILG